MSYAAFYHPHITSWAITILLFLISYLLLRQGKEKGQKVTHMILRLFFIFTVITGAGLVYTLNFAAVTLLKAILAIWLIAVMELILIKSKKKESVTGLWIQFIIALIAVLIMGYVVI